MTYLKKYSQLMTVCPDLHPDLQPKTIDLHPDLQPKTIGLSEFKMYFRQIDHKVVEEV
jgi:hypothetical protein